MPGRTFRVACALVAVLLPGTAAVPARADAPPAAETISIAPASYAAFSVRLFWLKRIRGRFEHLYGDLEWLPDRRQGIVRAWIDVDTARMDSRRFRRMLLGPGFLDAGKYPRIHFVSAAFDRDLLRLGGNVEGRLSMHGVTRPATFVLQPSRCTDPDTAVCILRLQGGIRRGRFGIRRHATILSDHVQLDLVIVLAPRGHALPDDAIPQQGHAGG